MKRCYVCGKSKALSEFHKNSSSSDGYGYECKECKRVLSRDRLREQRSTEPRRCKSCKELKSKSEYDGRSLTCNVCKESRSRADEIRRINRKARKNRYLEKFLLANYKDGKKRCRKCYQYKDTSSFWPRDKSVDGLFRYCKDCDTPSDIKKYQGTKTIDSHLRSSAKRRNIPYLISNDQKGDLLLWDKTNTTCAHCGISEEEYKEFVLTYGKVPEIKKYISGSQGSTRLTIDRIDSSKGYSLDNIQKSCWFCNSVKNCLFTDEDMTIIGPIIRNRLKQYIEGAPSLPKSHSENIF